MSLHPAPTPDMPLISNNDNGLIIWVIINSLLSIPTIICALQIINSICVESKCVFILQVTIIISHYTM